MLYIILKTYYTYINILLYIKLYQYILLYIYYIISILYIYIYVHLSLSLHMHTSIYLPRIPSIFSNHRGLLFEIRKFLHWSHVGSLEPCWAGTSSGYFRDGNTLPHWIITWKLISGIASKPLFISLFRFRSTLFLSNLDNLQPRFFFSATPFWTAAGHAPCVRGRRLGRGGSSRASARRSGSGGGSPSVWSAAPRGSSRRLAAKAWEAAQLSKAAHRRVYAPTAAARRGCWTLRALATARRWRRVCASWPQRPPTSRPTTMRRQRRCCSNSG